MRSREHQNYYMTSGLEVIKLEYSLKLKIKRFDWLLADKCFITLRPGLGVQNHVLKSIILVF